MSSIGRLLAVYFLGSPVLRWFTRAGVVLLLVSVFVVTNTEQSIHVLAFVMLGVTSLFLGSSLMPVTVGRLAQCRTLQLLPGLRFKLLISAALTVLLVALPVGLLTPLVYVAGVAGKVGDLARHPQLREYTFNLAWISYTSAILLAFWIYVLTWCVTHERNLAGLAKGLVVLLILIFAPAREFATLSASLTWNLQQIAVISLVFGALFLNWPRLSNYFAAWRRPAIGGVVPRGIAGREVDLILGNGNPWLLVAALVVPVFAATRVGGDLPSVWLLYLTISSTVAGALSGQSAERSRALWLRAGWSRPELFDQVERSAWRHHTFILGALLLFMLVAGIAHDMPRFVLLAGIPLVVLGTALSTYLGLMVTRGVRLPEILLGAGVMLTLMTLSLMIGAEARKPLPITGIITVLGGLALLLRHSARKRWTHLDWAQCRRERSSTARGTA